MITTLLAFTARLEVGLPVSTNTQSYAVTSTSTGCVWALVHLGDLIHTVGMH